MAKIRLTQGVMDEYDARIIFNGHDGWPEVPYEAGVYDLPEATIKAMLDDALHFVGPDAPDYLPANEKRIYAGHVKRCRAALA